MSNVCQKCGNLLAKGKCAHCEQKRVKAALMLEQSKTPLGHEINEWLRRYKPQIDARGLATWEAEQSDRPHSSPIA